MKAATHADVADLQRKLLIELKSREPDHAVVFRLREQIHDLKPDALLYWGFSGAQALEEWNRKHERRKKRDGLVGSRDR